MTLSPLHRAVSNIAAATSHRGMPQAYYVPLDEWHTIRDELMDIVGGPPRVDRALEYPFFQLLGVPVVPFSVLEAIDANIRPGDCDADAGSE